MHCFIRVTSEQSPFWTFVELWKLMSCGLFDVLVFSYHKFLNMHFLNEKEFLKNIKNPGGRHAKFHPAPWQHLLLCSLCSSTPPACTARNCDIYRDAWEEKFLEDKFLKVLKYLLGGKKAERDGILYYLELHFPIPFHYFFPKRESIPQAMVTFNRLVPQTG